MSQKRLLLMLLVLCSQTNLYANEEQVMPDTKETEVDKYKVDPNGPINSGNFDYKTKEEQDDYLDKRMEENNRVFLALNLTTLKEPRLSEEELEIKGEQLNDLIYQCNQIIGPEKWEEDYKKEHGIDWFEPPYAIYDAWGPISGAFMRRAQFYPLSNFMYKCVRYLYLKSDANPDSFELYKKYLLNDFEYTRQLTSKEQEVEKQYEKIYLKVKEVGLLRRMQYVYYPKSFLREHADKTGLTAFIKKEEAKAGHALKHDELAITFFGSREKWLTDLHTFLEMKIKAHLK